MATFVLIHGSGASAWHWHLVIAELEALGHEAIAIDLPIDDPAAGLSDYLEVAEQAVAALGDRPEGLVIAGHSFGSWTATWLADRVPARSLVLIAPMIPQPGETPGEWGANTNYEDAIADLIDAYGPRSEWTLDVLNEVLLSDVPFGLRIKVPAHARRQSTGPQATPLAIAAWPDVPTHVLLCRDDLLFPAEFVRRIARERLGAEADEIDGGHVAMLSRPAEVVERLASYA